MRCKAQTTAIAQLWRGFATPLGAQSGVLRAARDLISVALKALAPFNEGRLTPEVLAQLDTELAKL